MRFDLIGTVTPIMFSLSALGSLSGLPFYCFWPLTLANSNLQFTNLELGLLGSEQVGERFVNSMISRPEP